MNGPPDGAALWAFALALYQRPGVSAACLRLQDSHRLDVMVLLACLWAASRGLRLGAAEVAALAAAAGPWQARVTGRLRRARRAVAGRAPEGAARTAARAAILAAEQAAERVTADLLAAALPRHAAADGDGDGDAARGRHNLALYTQSVAAARPGADPDLAALCAAAFPHP